MPDPVRRRFALVPTLVVLLGGIVSHAAGSPEEDLPATNQLIASVQRQKRELKPQLEAARERAPRLDQAADRAKTEAERASNHLDTQRRAAAEEVRTGEDNASRELSDWEGGVAVGAGLFALFLVLGVGLAWWPRLLVHRLVDHLASIDTEPRIVVVAAVVLAPLVPGAVLVGGSSRLSLLVGGVLIGLGLGLGLLLGLALRARTVGTATASSTSTKLARYLRWPAVGLSILLIGVGIAHATNGRPQQAPLDSETVALAEAYASGAPPTAAVAALKREAARRRDRADRADATLARFEDKAADLDHELARLVDRRDRLQHQVALAALGCPDRDRVLDGVYHPSRLSVRDPCRKATGTVATLREEEDGDVHIGVDLDGPYRSMLMSNNFSQQDGNLVVELMPRDYGHITEPSIGDRVTIAGAYVDDTQHAWAEIHPVWALSVSGGPFQYSGPQYGGSPASALSDNALATCRTNTGAPCTGYGGAPAYQPPSGGGGGGNCDPNYSGCVPPYPPDVDCAQVDGPVQVVGSDPHGLDGNGDGVGCE